MCNLVPVAVLAVPLPAVLDVRPGHLDAVLEAHFKPPEDVAQHVEGDRPSDDVRKYICCLYAHLKNDVNLA